MSIELLMFVVAVVFPLTAVLAFKKSWCYTVEQVGGVTIVGLNWFGRLLNKRGMRPRYVFRRSFGPYSQLRVKSGHVVVIGNVYTSRRHTPTVLIVNGDFDLIGNVGPAPSRTPFADSLLPKKRSNTQ